MSALTDLKAMETFIALNVLIIAHNNPPAYIMLLKYMRE
jgi:hypothetical protein